jgi:hypothetical protein
MAAIKHDANNRFEVNPRRVVPGLFDMGFDMSYPLVYSVCRWSQLCGGVIIDDVVLCGPF